MEKSSHPLEFGKHASRADSMHALKSLWSVELQRKRCQWRRRWVRTLLPQQIDSAEEPLEIAVCLLVENGLCYCSMACMSETLDATRNRTTACQCCVAKPIFCENAKGSNAIATVSDLHLRVHCAAKIFIHPDNVPVGAAFLGGHPMRRLTVSATPQPGAGPSLLEDESGDEEESSSSKESCQITNRNRRRKRVNWCTQMPMLKVSSQKKVFPNMPLSLSQQLPVDNSVHRTR